MGQEGRRRVSITDKVLGRTAIEGRRVLFTFPTGIPAALAGYVCGWDLYHWLVLTPKDSLEHLVHKSNAALVTAQQHTVDQESQSFVKLYTEIVTPFRAYLIQNNIVPRHITAAAPTTEETVAC